MKRRPSILQLNANRIILMIISLLLTPLLAIAQGNSCAQIASELSTLRKQKDNYENRLKYASPAEKPYLTRQIREFSAKIAAKQVELNRCRKSNTQTSSDPLDDMPIWRVMLRVRTADVSDADTNDDVKVELNTNNLTWLDYGHDDFERGDNFSYDLLLKDVKNPRSRQSISNLGDITMLRISKTGDNGLCLREIDLIVNGRSIYREVFNSPGLWLDNADGHLRSYTVSRQKLRQNSHWRNYTQPDIPEVITRSEMESRIETIISNLIHGSPLHWGHLNGRAVEVSKKDDHTLRVDLDLAFTIDWVPDPWVDIKFDLNVSCSRGRISLTAQEYKVTADSKWYHEILSLGLLELADDRIEDGISDALRSITSTQDTGQPFCPAITVTDNGDVHLVIPSLP